MREGCHSYNDRSAPKAVIAHTVPADFEEQSFAEGPEEWRPDNCCYSIEAAMVEHKTDLMGACFAVNYYSMVNFAAVESLHY